MSQGLYVPNLKALGAPKKKCQLHTHSQPASHPHLEFKVKVSKLKPSQKRAESDPPWCPLATINMAEHAFKKECPLYTHGHHLTNYIPVY